MELDIRVDDLSGPEVRALLRDHLTELRRVTPEGSVYALDLAALTAPDITFWSAWAGAELVGCGALKELSPDHGEIKSMRTSPGHRRSGVAARVLDHLIAEGRRRGYRALSLETGATEWFAPARALYERRGFERCGPFGDYGDDPHSYFMRLELGPADPGT